MTNEELVKAFREYVGRFDEEIGPKEFGQFGTWERQLVKKLKYDEFVEKYKQYKEMEEVLEGINERGDTINDVMVHALREVATELVIRIPGSG
ncbi:MAG: hypothetical protein RBU30_00705 [Polyangia bacterium]|jgi:hypothetical protein|nr:hypothetical protein [Polyangia bacterium]